MIAAIFSPSTPLLPLIGQGLGMGGGEVVVETFLHSGVQYTAADSRLHFTAEDCRPHYTSSDNRLHYRKK